MNNFKSRCSNCLNQWGLDSRHHCLLSIPSELTGKGEEIKECVTLKCTQYPVFQADAFSKLVSSYKREEQEKKKKPKKLQELAKTNDIL